MVNPEHVEILKQGVEVWNKWRKDNPLVIPDFRVADLHGANLSGADLHGASFTQANLAMAHLSKADLSEAHLRSADLTKANLANANLMGANLAMAHLAETDLREANLREAYLVSAILREADLREANLIDARLSNSQFIKAHLSGANLKRATLTGTNFTGSDLTGTNLERTILIDTIFEGATLNDCYVYGISAWNVNLKDAKQSNLVITPKKESIITVDNLQVAQFIYLLLNNAEIRHVIDTITSKAVLILGRFSTKRKAVLDTIRDELRKRDYLPIVFDFDKPSNRTFSETVTTLANMSRFVIVDLSDPNSSPHEVTLFSADLRSVPLQPIFCPTKEHPNPYPMFKDHTFGHIHVLPIYRYTTQEELMQSLSEKVIAPVEAKLEELRKLLGNM